MEARADEQATANLPARISSRSSAAQRGCDVDTLAPAMRVPLPWRERWRKTVALAITPQRACCCCGQKRPPVLLLACRHLCLAGALAAILALIKEKFPYLVKKKLKEGEEVRRIAQLDWRIIEPDCEKPFISSGIEFIPLPVMHGEDYVCLGFLFGKKSRIAYISDVSRIPASTEQVISKSEEWQLDLLILDTLYKSLDAVKRTKAKTGPFIGMTHEFDHHKVNKSLTEWSNREGIPVQLARDGMQIFLEF
ncbi:hypothetical protein HPP92_018655 [Vanilla planifolia]|uniref:Metallo-beta-lactamase domain-containing protein n=1 Tax=Vanilla planifolia TaxID=51239 RepID=A0A835Q643_VANPL|nr:hypothetical protein HPP92_018655 [Vanilla planifolia]